MKLNDSSLVPSREDLKIERSQCIDEGKDVSPFEAEFAQLDVPEVDQDPVLIERAEKLLDNLQRLGIREDYQFVEPSKIGEIQRSREGQPIAGDLRLGREVLFDKIHGAWTGRCVGCLLGKGVEGRRRGQIEEYLRGQDRWPLTTWFSNDAPDALRSKCEFRSADHPFYIENITCMVQDDDTNYTTIALSIVKERGGDFTPLDVAESWLGNIPFYKTWTAERATYRNLLGNLPVPDNAGDFEGEFCTATFRNPYREWIGAQIRGDFFGYCWAGDPQRAAQFAWRDATISHVKNGIYGEMWVAGMLASAFGCDDVASVIRAGLAEVPPRSRFRRDIEEVFTWRAEGRSYLDAVNTIGQKWNEDLPHHWCHTNSNAQIVAVALLWGEMDFGKTICSAVSAGFDTDCNAATAGSVMGLMLGRKVLPGEWAEPIQDTLQTCVDGYFEVKLEDMAAETIEIIEKLRR